MAHRPVCLTIAGTDSGGGAGIAADLATFGAHDVWGTCAVAAVTAQDTLAVHAAAALAPAMVRAQIEAVVRDLGVDAAKTGMLANADIVLAVAACVRDLGVAPLVIDPVLAATGGASLLDDDAVGALLAELLPLAALITPNAPEAEQLSGVAVDSRAGVEDAARRLVDLGAPAVLVKGGHLDLGDGRCSDCLVVGRAPVRWFDAPRLEVTTTHGTGCVLSAAITARLARGDRLADAVIGAKAFLQVAMVAGVRLGAGPGSVDRGRPGRADVLGEEAIDALAPDDASRIAAAAVARSPDWYSLGHDGELAWGVVAGSARNRYDVVVDTSDAPPVLGCTCPSRKQPCKHVLALLLKLARGQVPEGTIPASMVVVLENSKTTAVAPPAPPRRSDDVVDVEAQAKRRQRRAANVGMGVDDLERWLEDVVAGGLAAARTRPHSAYEATAARLVDAQAPGLAGRLRGLSATVHGGPGWPDRALAELGELHLLVEGWRRLPALPDPLAAQLRTQLGFSTSRGDVLATPPWRDRWDVVATIVIENPDLTSRRVWLRGRTVGGWALLLDHVPPGGRFDVAAAVGTSFEAELHRYPGAGTHRALLGVRDGEVEPMGDYDGSSVADALAGHALAVGANPWTAVSPVALQAVVPVDGDPWVVVDEAGDAMPLVGPSWPLLAVSAGNPVGVVGEWNGKTLTPLSCWFDGALAQIALM